MANEIIKILLKFLGLRSKAANAKNMHFALILLFTCLHQYEATAQQVAKVIDKFPEIKRRFVDTVPRPVYTSSGVMHTMEQMYKYEIFTAVQKQPEYPGGLSAFYTFIYQNLNYSSTGVVTGQTTIGFIIEPNGFLGGVQALRSPNQYTANEAVRVINLSGKWKPGEQDNHPVRTYKEVTVDFKPQRQ